MATVYRIAGVEFNYRLSAATFKAAALMSHDGEYKRAIDFINKRIQRFIKFYPSSSPLVQNDVEVIQRLRNTYQEFQNTENQNENKI